MCFFFSFSGWNQTSDKEKEKADSECWWWKRLMCANVWMIYIFTLASSSVNHSYHHYSCCKCPSVFNCSVMYNSRYRCSHNMKFPISSFLPLPYCKFPPILSQPHVLVMSTFTVHVCSVWFIVGVIFIIITTHLMTVVTVLVTQLGLLHVDHYHREWPC